MIPVQPAPIFNNIANNNESLDRTQINVLNVKIIILVNYYILGLAYNKISPCHENVKNL